MARYVKKKESCLTRICGCCNKEMYIGKDNIDEAIYYDKKTYHSECFIDMKIQIHAPKLIREVKTLPKSMIFISMALIFVNTKMVIDI